MKLITLLFLSLSSVAFGQNFYDLNTIQTIEIVFTQSNWDYQLDTSKAGADGYIMAKSCTINGVTFDSVGVKYKGNSTYNANQKKNPFHIELDTYKDLNYQGYTDVKLSNVAKDPSFVREVLSYQILRQYMDAPLSNYANVSVNGQLIGLYSNSESISKKFVDNHFYSKSNVFVKCNPIDGAGPGNTALPNLVYLGTDSSLYAAAYEMKSDYGWKELIALCDTLKNNINAIEKVLDVDRALWMLAFDNVFVNLDSYIGGFAQNYYLYQDDNGLFNPIVWDLNESLGTFSQTGTINLNNTSSKQQMTHLLHLNDAAWPLVQKLLSIPKYKRMYVAHMKTMLTENFANGSYYTTAQSFQTVIDNAVQSDPNKFFTYAQYQSNLNSDVSAGMSSAPGIKNLMEARSTYLLGLTDFTATAPTISAIQTSISTPSINDKVGITTKIENGTDVYLSYRFSKQKPFVTVKMYDDGSHQDGASGDKVYGAEITMDAEFAEYFFYAENSNAGQFSPARAAHEFYTLRTKQLTIQKGELVINELMADNSATVTDTSGKFEDWIEFYNNTSDTLYLDNLYLSDSYTSPYKWKFPDGVTIAPKGFLIVWADGDEDEMDRIHSSIKFSASGEKAILSYADGYVVDSISFGQQIADSSFARFPNGTGSFVIQAPTFNMSNGELSSVKEINKLNASLKVYPNPASGILNISSDETPIEYVEVTNTQGQIVFKSSYSNLNHVTVNLSAFANGLYLINVNDQARLKVLKN